jgi:hypothetical protein
LGGEVVPGFGAKANITVTIDLEDLKTATADAIGQNVHSGGLSAATFRRLACDAQIIPIVLGSNSEPLDVGRCERLVTRAMRRALNTRDRGCVVCGAPPIMCDSHHLISWIDGGITAVSNLALVCRRHHTDLHNGHWTITLTAGQVEVSRPTWADPPAHLQPSPNPQPPAPPTATRPATAATAASLRRAQAATAPPAPEPPSASPDDGAARRDATYLAIWGERPPAGPGVKSAHRFPTSAPLDPWGESVELSSATTAADPP